MPRMENGVSSNLRSPGGAVRNSSGIFYVLKDLSSYTLSMFRTDGEELSEPSVPTKDFTISGTQNVSIAVSGRP